jgi:hypothetical protein
VKNLFILVAVFFLLSFKPTYADSSYVLPYPSAMPGSFSYKLHLLEELVMQYWYFGDFGQFNYNLKLADKYLVEGKILMEYKQYLLGYNALQKSNNYFSNTKQYLLSARNHKKDIVGKQLILKEASLKHLEELNALRNIVPKEFNWTLEKAKARQLDIRKLIDDSIRLRRNYEKINF